MAEKKKDEFSYGSAFLPEGERKYSVIRWGWKGLNRTDKIDTGQLTDMSGVVCDPPYMEPVKYAKEIIDFSTGIPYEIRNIIGSQRHSGIPISISGNYSTDQKMISLVWQDQETQKLDVSRYEYIGKPKGTEGIGWYCRGHFELHDSGLQDLKDKRTLLMFNAVNTSSGNIADYTYDRKQLIYPDCYSLPITPTGTASSFNTEQNPIPVPLIATVYGSRVFGINDENLVTASAFNSYVDYSLDTSDDVSSAHAWASMAGSNVDASGSFTAICTYDNHVVLWRKDFMQLVYNNKNPFRIVDVGKFGCDNNNAWTILNNVLYFASDSKVYAYTGGTPKVISSKLEAGNLAGAVLGSFKDTVWMQTDKGLYSYKNGVWSYLGYSPFRGNYYHVEEFATVDYGLAALVNLDPNSENPTYALYFIDWDTTLMDLDNTSIEYWNPEYANVWFIETDLMALGKLDIRRVKKISVMCQGEKDSVAAVYLLPDNEEYSPEFDDEYKVGYISFDKREIKVLRVLTRQFSGTWHKLRIAGYGYVKIHAAELKVSWGGDVYADS